MTDQFDADVIIAGYGPTGVAAANALGSRGIRTIAIERNQDIYSRARAVTINDWTLRCFQSVGLADALVKDLDETFALRWKMFDGTELDRITFPDGMNGYASSYSIYQPVMEQTLRDGAARYADAVTVRYGEEVTDLTQDAEGATVTIRDLASGVTSTLRARYILACDGGSSGIREKLGIAMLGDTIETKWVIIDAFVKRWWPDRHVLTFWSDRERPVVDIALSLGTHRWELPLKPQETEADFATHDQLWTLLATMGVTPDDVDIHQHAFYKHHVRHAERWRHGRVFLLGDAAHLMPPWAGQGMQSGIRDSFNLSWKLAEVIGGRLPDAVLDTFEVERAPDVARYTEISVLSGRMVRLEIGEEELAAMRPPADAPPELPPLLQPPRLLAGWVAGDTGDASAVGKLIPQPEVANTNGRLLRLDDALGNGFVLLGDGIDPRAVLTAAQRASWEALGATYRTVRSPDQRGEGERDIIDLRLVLLAWMRGYGAMVIAVRPDRFVVAADGTGLDIPVPTSCDRAQRRSPVKV